MILLHMKMKHHTTASLSNTYTFIKAIHNFTWKDSQVTDALLKIKFSYAFFSHIYINYIFNNMIQTTKKIQSLVYCPNWLLKLITRSWPCFFRFRLKSQKPNIFHRFHTIRLPHRFKHNKEKHPSLPLKCFFWFINTAYLDFLFVVQLTQY